MRCVRFVGFVIAICLVIIPGNPISSEAYEDTQCFVCHTSAKKLIEITREIAKTRPVLKSAQTEGEG